MLIHNLHGVNLVCFDVKADEHFREGARADLLHDLILIDSFFPANFGGDAGGGSDARVADAADIALYFAGLLPADSLLLDCPPAVQIRRRRRLVVVVAVVFLAVSSRLTGHVVGLDQVLLAGHLLEIARLVIG